MANLNGKECVMSKTMLRRREVVEATGLCYTTILNLERNGKFPARRQLTPGRVAWRCDEVEAWLDARVFA